MIEACDWRKAIELLAEMKDKGIEPSVVTYSVAIKACGIGGQWQTALELLETMRQKDMPINRYVYNAAITAVSKAAKTRRETEKDDPLWIVVRRLLDQMREDDIEPDGFSYTSAISCFGSEGRWQEALALIEEMQQSGPQTRPNKIAYTAAISSCGRAGQVDHAMRLFQQMSEEGLSLDCVAYNALFSALRVAKRDRDAFNLWDEMLENLNGQPSRINVIPSRKPPSPDIITLTE